MCRLVIVLGDESLDLGSRNLDASRNRFSSTPPLPSTAGHRSEDSQLGVDLKGRMCPGGVRPRERG